MRVGIMQPYFFPYLGHFSLIAACERWVVFDISQYTPRSWMNRNRVLHPVSGASFVGVPVAGSSIHMQTRSAMLVDPEAARTSVLGSLSHYRRQARYHDRVAGLVDQVFSTRPHSLVALNVRALGAVCAYLGIGFSPVLSSALALEVPARMGPGDWAPLICGAVGATEYVNPIGGAGLFDPAAFGRAGVALRFLETTPFRYATGRFGFVPDLSILDVLMWNDPAAVRAAIDAHARLVMPEPA